MNSTFSYTLLKRAQLSSIWNAAEFSALEADRYCALAHSCLVALVRTANDARLAASDFDQNSYLSNPPTGHSSVDFKCRDNGENVVLVAALDIAAAKKSVGDFVSMGLGGKWNAVFEDACNSITLDGTSLPMVISTVRMKSSTSSCRILQARDDALQSEGAQSHIIIGLHSVGPLSAAGCVGSSGDDRAQLLSGFVIEALDDSHSRVTCV